MSLITINRPVVLAPELDSILPRAARSWRRRAALGVAVLAAIGLSVGVTDALATPSPDTSTTNVSFVPLSPAFTVFKAKAFAANLKFSAVVIGGSTKVPSDATTVELDVEAGGKTAGSMNFYPAGNTSGGSGQTLSWTAGSTDSSTIEENVGTANELTFANGTTAATSTATIVGYSTQVTDGDISATDGSQGQILTNTGDGASWQTPNFAPADTATLVVHPGSDPLQNGAELVQAVEYSGDPVIEIEAGTYDISGNGLGLHVGESLIGAGPNESIIVSSSERGDIDLSDNSSMVGVAVQFTGDQTLAIEGNGATLQNDAITQIDTSTSDQPTTVQADGADVLDDVSITNTSAGSFVTALLHDSATTLVVRDSTIVGNGGSSTIGTLALRAFHPVDVYDSQLSALGGAEPEAVDQAAPTTVTVEGSELHAPAGDALVAQSGSDVYNVATSMIDGQVPGLAMFTCVDSYNASFAPVGSGC